MKKFLIVFASLLLFSCRKQSKVARGVFEKDDIPVILVAKSKNGIIIKLANGEAYHYRSSYYMAKTILSSEFQVGDTIIK